MGTIIIGKMESGVLVKGQTLTVMPNRVSYVEGLMMCFVCNIQAIFYAGTFFMFYKKENLKSFSQWKLLDKHSSNSTVVG